MLLLEPVIYYKEILKRYKNSYLAEDDFQAIIGIDCEYVEGEDIKTLEKYFEICKNSPKKNSAKFAGLFGVLSYEMVYEFERIAKLKKSLYNLPKFFYANAKSYLHYDKISKIYTFYGDDFSIYENLENFKPEISQKKSNLYYKILTNLEAEKNHFYKIVEEAKHYIKQGDVFQVVPAEILSLETNLSSIDFYEVLKVNNPSPYMFHFPTKYGDVVGSSPELVMQIRDDEILVAPIAGTRKRGKNANEDEVLRRDLLSDEKELAEHKMLIDLARNDIGKFAKPSSVAVKKPMHVVFYESVMHIVSEVYGKKRKGVSAFEVISTVFPAGTLSGTPKIRAMQIINELENSQRGIYGGGLGFWHFNGDVQMAILIRSAMFVPKYGEKLKLSYNGTCDMNLNSSEKFDENLVLNSNEILNNNSKSSLNSTSNLSVNSQDTLDESSNSNTSSSILGENSTLNLSENQRKNLNLDDNLKSNLDKNLVSNSNETINLVFVGAGAGIVYDSVKENEYAEICNKRESCVKVIRELCEEK
ncbi:anthranilate synthase component I family protein [Campylobacter geochelonis]|uniref:Anthranilate synthase component 1 n=1 Tax=Campylobacter geochelonis TaxID=1780362 RepID=A0A128EA25_9BACT|nr:anthranilate synthase component I family protein [Campylobacter geochelonis]QKF70658.1 anthranilate synthase component I [Campylobacter geochelonis]CZE45840.1 anthranilate synthase component 1 [Campylobacter geochelonis]